LINFFLLPVFDKYLSGFIDGASSIVVHCMISYDNNNGSINSNTNDSGQLRFLT